LDDTIIEEYTELPEELLIASSTMVSGNTVIKDIRDIVLIHPEKFDKLHTLEIVKEIDDFNRKLKNSNTPYILIGFGRWGTFDRFLGVPVKWQNISGASVIIETGLKDFQVEHSQGSHFFQNITTANIPYFYIKYGSNIDSLDWDWLSNPKLIVEEKEYMRHIRTPDPLLVVANGKTRKGFIGKSTD
jgi:hypothetical protein